VGKGKRNESARAGVTSLWSGKRADGIDIATTVQQTTTEGMA
jgi:hypothetical protein